MKKNRLLFAMMGVAVLVLVLAASPLVVSAKTTPTPAAAPAPAAVSVSAIGFPNLVITPLIVPLDKNSRVVLAGSGFEPGQMIDIKFVDPTIGALSIINGLMDPEPIVNEQGCWASSLTLGRFASRGILTEGFISVWVADENGVVLASAPLGFVDVTKPREEWPAWAQTAIPEAPE